MGTENQPLRWWEVAQAVRGQRIGRRVVYRTAVDSTMEVCHALARAGEAPGVVVVADAQTAGRGRQGRSWQAPPYSSLLFSILLRPALPHAQWPRVLWPLAVALAEASERVAGARPAIKWPNDLMLCGRKLGGLLAETTTGGVVVGAGVNVNFAAAALSLDQPLTTLADARGHPISRETLLIASLRSFEQWYRRWLAAPDEVWAAWRAGSCLIGRQVDVTVGAAVYRGSVEDQDRDGYLCVRAANGQVRRFAAGDARVRLAPGRPAAGVRSPRGVRRRRR